MTSLPQDLAESATPAALEDTSSSLGAALWQICIRAQAQALSAVEALRKPQLHGISRSTWWSLLLRSEGLPLQGRASCAI